MGREFHNLILSKVRKLFLKFVEVYGREHPSDEDGLVEFLCMFCFKMMKRLTIIILPRKKQKWTVIKHKTKIHTEAREFETKV